MKICSNCSSENSNESLFCQECGEKLNLNKEDINHYKSKKKNIDSIYQKLNTDDMDDVIFCGKKKSHAFRNVVLIILVIFSILFVAVLFESNDFGTSFSQPTPTPINTYNLISNLDIENYDIKWIGQETYFVGTIRNNNLQHVKDVVVRIDFAWDEAMEKLFDTRYVTIETVPSSGAFSFSLPVSVYQSKQYWYQYKIESVNTF